MSIKRGMNTEDMVHKHNGILLSHKKERNAICSNMDDPRDILSEVRERQILYDAAYMWNLKKKDTNRLIYRSEVVIDVENNLLITRGEKGKGINWETGTDIYTHYI